MFFTPEASIPPPGVSCWRRLSSMMRDGTTSVNALTAVRGSPIRWLVVGGALLIAAITIGATIMAGNSRERALNSSVRELDNTVLLLARHFDQQLQDLSAIQEVVSSVSPPASPPASTTSVACPAPTPTRCSRPSSTPVLCRRTSTVRCRRPIRCPPAPGRSRSASHRAYFRRFIRPRSPLLPR